MSKSKSFLTSVILVLLAAVPCKLQGAAIDFEGLGDLESVTTQFPGLTFTNTISLTAGVSLNEIDFPPRSGSVVVSDDGGPITILFATPTLAFSAYFTYITQLTLEAFDTTDSSVDLAFTQFAANDGFSGEPGSSPNELLQVTSAGGIARVVITGDAFGGSFVMDDIEYETAVPEPTSLSMFALALGLGTLLSCKRIRS